VGGWVGGGPGPFHPLPPRRGARPTPQLRGQLASLCWHFVWGGVSNFEVGWVGSFGDGVSEDLVCVD
jgi:hypothetical protein